MPLSPTGPSRNNALILSGASASKHAISSAMSELAEQRKAHASASKHMQS